MSEASDAILAGRHRALTHVAPGLVHDLRGPLNAVFLNLELLKSLSGSVDEEVGEKLERYLGVVEEELHRFQDRFDGFVHHVFPPEETPGDVDLRQTLHEVRDLLYVQARKDNVRIEMQEPDEPIVVDGRAGRLRDALLQMAAVVFEADSTADRHLYMELVQPEDRRARVLVRGSRPASDSEDVVPPGARHAWEGQGGEVDPRPGTPEGFEVHMNFPLDLERESRTDE